jgi:hypothetical protein
VNPKRPVLISYTHTYILHVNVHIFLHTLYLLTPSRHTHTPSPSLRRLSLSQPASTILINLGPDLLDMLALLFGRLAVQPRALEPQPAQTHVDFVFGVGAVAGDFPDEAARVALIERGDDVGAA